MAHRTRTSPTIEKAQKRQLSLKSIDSFLDLGNGLTLREFTNLIDDTQQKIDRYNLAIKGLTQLYDEMIDSERQLASEHERMLSGVLAKYGRNSTEYEMAGGSKRTAKRKPKATQLPEIPVITIPANSTTDPKPQAVNALMN